MAATVHVLKKDDEPEYGDGDDDTPSRYVCEACGSHKFFVWSDGSMKCGDCAAEYEM